MTTTAAGSTRGESPLPNSQRLRSEIARVRPRLEAAAARIWSHPRVTDLYPSYLIAAHGLVRASVPLMEAALDRARERAPDDAVAGAMVDYLSGHIPEERGHDEWILEDLEAVGGSRQDALGRFPSLSTARAVGAQYYWIHHVHPVALLGFIAVLEGHPPSVAGLDQLVRITGLPKVAFRTLYGHAGLDVRHRDDLDDLLDRLPLDERLRSLMEMSATHTVDQLTGTLEEVVSALAGG
jgi:hypothetical protein